MTVIDDEIRLLGRSLIHAIAFMKYLPNENLQLWGAHRILHLSDGWFAPRQIEAGLNSVLLGQPYGSSVVSRPYSLCPRALNVLWNSLKIPTLAMN